MGTVVGSPPVLHTRLFLSGERDDAHIRGDRLRGHLHHSLHAGHTNRCVPPPPHPKHTFMPTSAVVLIHTHDTNSCQLKDHIKMCTLTHTLMQSRTHTHTRHKQFPTKTPHQNVHTHTLMQTCTHTHTQANMRSRTHTHTRHKQLPTKTPHQNAHTRTHTHTCKHTQSYSYTHTTQTVAN